jgi:hypothetical protein
MTTIAMQAKNQNYISDTERDTGSLSPALQKTVWISISLVLVLSLLDLTGWMAGINLLKSIAPNWESMRAITALCFIFTVLGLLIIFTKRPASIKSIEPVIPGYSLLW